MLFQGEQPHPAHKIFGDAVNADYRHFESGEPIPASQDLNSIEARIRRGLQLQRYDILVAEGTAPLQTLLISKLRHPTSTIIYLAADETFYNLNERPTRHIWRISRPVTNKLLNGVIAVGRDVYEWARPYLGNVPVRYVYPPISDDKYALLSELSPTSPQDPFVVISAGTVKPANGYPQLAAVIDRISDCIENEIELVILGSGHSEQPYANSPRVSTPGFVDTESFAEHFSRASLYVQSSIGDSFPVAVLESLLSGTPTLVTEAVGVREILPEGQVVEPTFQGIFEGIKEFYHMSHKERQTLGAKQRPLVNSITEEAQERQFKRAIKELI